MKKIIALILAMLMVLSLAACGSSSDDAADNGSATETTADGELWEQAVGKTYTVGTDTTFAPFEFEDENGERTGIDVLLMEAIAEEMGFTVDWQILGFSASVTALESGQVDAVMAAMSITDARLEKYDFSVDYYTCNIGAAVAAGSDITDIEGLRGQTVVCKSGTTSCEYAHSLEEEYDLQITEVEESAIMYQYVESGQAVACFEDYPIMQYEISRGNVDLTVIHESGESAAFPTGVAVMQGNYPEFIAAFNEGFARMQADGRYDAILAQFFGE